MRQQLANSGKQWSKSDSQTFKTLARKKTPARIIASRMGRTENAIRKKAQEWGISLKCTTLKMKSTNGHKTLGRGSRTGSNGKKWQKWGKWSKWQH